MYYSFISKLSQQSTVVSECAVTTIMSGAKNVVSFLNKCVKTFADNGGLDSALQALKVISGSPGHCTMSMVVEKAHANM